MKIVIDPFDQKSVSNALDQVRKYKKDFQSKEKEFCRRLAEIGVRLAGGIYSVADYDGEHDVSVYLQETGNGYAVIAEGATVGFLEFGTGIRNREWGGDHLEYTPPPHGSFGKGHGKQPWGWWFKSQEYGLSMHTYGNPPAEGMLTARDAMVQQITQIAREVWDLIDKLNEVFTSVATVVRNNHIGITVIGENARHPSKFPTLTIDEIQNVSVDRLEDSSNAESFAGVVYKLQVFSNKQSGKKTEARAIFATADAEMRRMGFRRVTYTTTPEIYDSTVYSITATYEAVVSTAGYVCYKR